MRAQVAEMEEEKEILGMIRGCLKTVTCGKKLSRNDPNKPHHPVYTKLAYILGLRVSPSHRYCIAPLTHTFHISEIRSTKKC